MTKHVCKISSLNSKRSLRKLQKILGATLFCRTLYTDGLLNKLRESGVGCHVFDNVFVGALAYADDIALLAPTPQAMRHLLYICERYAKEFSIKFNADKSAWMYVTKRKQLGTCVPQFCIGGHMIKQTNDVCPFGTCDLPA